MSVQYMLGYYLNIIKLNLIRLNFKKKRKKSTIGYLIYTQKVISLIVRKCPSQNMTL